MKVLPFVTPSDRIRKERIRFAEWLLAEEIADRKTSFATDNGTFEFGIFRASGGKTLGVFLARDTKGKIIGGDVRQFTERHGRIWFQEMQQWML